MSTKENTFLKSLAPKDYGKITKEDFNLYINRVGCLVSNIPECVLYDWIYRNYDSIVFRYSSLRFDKIRFALEEWSTEDIYQLIHTDSPQGFDRFSYQLYDKNTTLKRYILEHRTWPLPIIVLENREGQHLTDRSKSLGQPFHLLEGHLRLDYFRRLYREERDTLPERHFVWRAFIS